MGTVELTVAPDVLSAEMIVAELRDVGIPAYAKSNVDRSYYAGVGAVSVFVDEADEAAAREIIDDPSRALEVDPNEPHYVDPRRRRRFGMVLAAVLFGIPILSIAIVAIFQ
ncbi:MAG: DUF2007 domain-containing protein [Acidimicrobiales bacterium]